MTGGDPIDIDDIVISVRESCRAFRTTKPAWMIPGSSYLFLFPSLLYGQLAQYAQLGGGGNYHSEASARTLTVVKRIIHRAAKHVKAEKVLIDTSPFFGGASARCFAAAQS
jgi:hypothetical protein